MGFSLRFALVHMIEETARHCGHLDLLREHLDGLTGTVSGTVDIGGQPGLRPGLYVDVELVTAREDDALLVPKRAVLYENDRTFVFRIVDGRAERVELIPAMADVQCESCHGPGMVHFRYHSTDGKRGTEEAATISSSSLYAYLSAKLSRRWTIGLRYDDTELPWDRFELYDGMEFREGLGERAISPFITFWQSEYVRMRLQYQNVSRDFAFYRGDTSDERLTWQVTFAAGPHKHESY